MTGGFGIAKAMPQPPEHSRRNRAWRAPSTVRMER